MEAAVEAADRTLWQEAIQVAFIEEGTWDGKSVSDAESIAGLIADVISKGAHPDHPAVQCMIARLAQLAGVIEGLSYELTRQMIDQYVLLEGAVGPDFVGTPSATG